jgi:hypothetical protein
LDRRVLPGFRRCAGRKRGASIIVAVAVILVVLVVVLVVVVPVVVILVEILVVLLVLVVRARPAFRLLGQLEVEFLPGLVVDLLDVAILVLELDQFRILVHREDLEGLLVLEAFVPLPGYRVVIAAHAAPLRDPGPARGPGAARYYGRGPNQGNAGAAPQPDRHARRP